MLDRDSAEFWAAARKAVENAFHVSGLNFCAIGTQLRESLTEGTSLRRVFVN